MKRILFALLILVNTSVLAQQFSCPSASESACDSYQELVKAADPEVTSPTVKYACFHDDDDVFFTIQASRDYVPADTFYKWNEWTAQYDLYGHPVPGSVYLQTYVRGVQDESRMPSIYTAGHWSLSETESTYVGEKLGSVFIDDDKIFADSSYHNLEGKKVEYSLTIQRSTKRFSENFLGDTGSIDIMHTGRCIQLGDLPKAPNPPQLTNDQKAEKDKHDYCYGPNLPDSDAGYCTSPFIYSDDYQRCTVPNLSKADRIYCNSAAGFKLPSGFEDANVVYEKPWQAEIDRLNKQPKKQESQQDLAKEYAKQHPHADKK